MTGCTGAIIMECKFFQCLCSYTTGSQGYMANIRRMYGKLCPEYVLKCNKSVHLPTWVSFLCLLGDLVVIWVWFGLGELWVINQIKKSERDPRSCEVKKLKKLKNKNKNPRKKHSLHITDINWTHTWPASWPPVIAAVSWRSESVLGFISNCLSYFTTAKISLTSIHSSYDRH